MERTKPSSLAVQIASFVFTRWVVNIQVRMFYPFLAVFARGLGISLADISLAVMARGFVGATMPFLAPLADRYGRRVGILLGLGLFIASNTLVVALPTLPTFFLSVCFSMVGVFLVISSIQAHIGDAVPYPRRGLAIALTELGWSLSFILGMPLVAYLLARAGWRAPFRLAVGMGVAAFLLLCRVLPASGQVSSTSTDGPDDLLQKHSQSPGGAESQTHRSLGLANLRLVLASPAARAALVIGLAFTAANEVVNLVFGVWMEDSFGLNILALGIASTVIGFSELAGEGLTASLVDRVGKERSIRIGLVLNGLFALVLPWLGRSGLAGALAGLFLFYLSFEFSVVSMLPLMTEILPEARATLMGVNVAAYALGRALGAFLAPRLYLLGFRANVLAALVFDIISILLLSRVCLTHKASQELISTVE